MLIAAVFSPPSAFASDVVINEFVVDPDSEQWVELYNKGSQTVIIGGWFIDDNGGSQKYTIPQGTEIHTQEFKLFESGLFNLNKSSADAVRLIQGDSEIDSYSYSIGPGTNKSYGRQADASDTWVVFESPSKGGSNNFSQSSSLPTDTPAPTLKPTDAPTPTRTPTPPKTPTPTRTPTPIKTPTPTKIPTRQPPTLTKKVSVASASNQSVQPTITVSVTKTFPTAVLGAKTMQAVPTRSPTIVLAGEKKTKLFLGTLFVPMGIGGFLLGCGILYYLKKRKESQDYEG